MKRTSQVSCTFQCSKLRIIGGKYKGRIINPIPGLKARPTTDFARESLFNILNNRVDFESISVLDLFSGTGALDLSLPQEELRWFILLKKIQSILQGSDRRSKKSDLRILKPIHIDVKAYLKTCRFKYDIVFADPPYDLSG